jgi:PPOX class probable F420-dependent enzyme
MEIDDARAFVREHHRAIVCTYRRDGAAQLSPALAGVDPDGRIEISSNAPKAKVRNLLRDPRISLLVMTEKFFERRWIQVDGTAEVVPFPRALDLLLGYERRMGSEPEDVDAYRREQEAAQAVMILVTIDRVGPKGSRISP